MGLKCGQIIDIHRINLLYCKDLWDRFADKHYSVTSSYRSAIAECTINALKARKVAISILCHNKQIPINFMFMIFKYFKINTNNLLKNKSRNF